MLLSLAGFAVLLTIAFLGFPLGFSMILVGFVGFAMVRGTGLVLETVSQQILDLALNANFVTLTLFVLMGVFVFRAALAEDIYDAAQSWLGNKRGGVAMATVAACAGFASISGSSVATAADGQGLDPADAEVQLQCGVCRQLRRRQRDDGHSDPALCGPDHLRHPDRTEHRRSVHRRAHPGNHHGSALYSGDLDHRAILAPWLPRAIS